MKTENALLSDLIKRGLKLALAPNGGLEVVAPEGALTPDLLELLRQHKAALLATLATEGGENDNGKKDALSEPAPPPADLADLASPTAAAAPAVAPDPADLAGQPGWLGDGTTALLDRLHAAGCRPDAVPDGETFVADCPRCHRRRAVAIRDTAAGVPAVQVRCPCGDAALLALDGLEPLGIGAPRRQPARRRPRGPGCCQRCGHDRYRDVAIHGGQSIRRDCARCGFLIGFPLWYGTNDPDLAPAAGDDPTADRHGDAPAGPGAAADDGPVTPYWPRWAVQFHLRLVRAGCEPKIVTATGEAGRKVLAIEATCPSCRRAGALSAWPWNTGMMFAHCRGGCERRAIYAALDAAAPLAESERLST